MEKERTGSHISRKLEVGLIDGEIPYHSSAPRDETVMNQYQENIMLALEQDLDILIGAEYAFYPYEPLTLGEKKEKWEEMREISENYDTLLLPGTYLWAEDGELHNTLPIFRKGEFVLTYDKQKGVKGEKWIASAYDLTYKADPCAGVFDFKGLSVGVEICYDHQDRRLIKSGKENLDLQILVANGKGFIPSSTVLREGGYHLRCDGDDGYFHGVEVRQKVNNDFVKYTPDTVVDLNYGMSLNTYTIEL